MSAPRVSVVMSVFNGEAYLEAALASVLRQTYADFELIAVDDGSEDNTAVLLAGAAAEDDRVVVITNVTNRGLTASLNRGLRAARGELIARQDADDLSEPGRLGRQVAFLDRFGDVGLVGTAYHEIDPAGQRLTTRFPPDSDTGIRAQMLFHNALCHTSVMLRRSLLAHAPGGYDEQLRYSQDVALWSTLLDHCQGANLTEPLVSLRKHPENVSTRHAAEQQRAATQVALRQIRRLAPELALSEAEVQTLRDWYGGLPPKAPPDQLGLCHRYFDLIDALAERPDADGVALDAQRSLHARALLLRATPAQLVGLLRTGVLPRLARVAPLTFASVGGHRLLRRARRALGAGGTS